jgi:flagella synthesis protein FlgN
MSNRLSSPADSLHEERTAAQALADLLAKEQASLIKAEIEALAALSEEKALLVARMTELAKDRHAALGALGFEASETGMQVWLQTPQAPKAAIQAWNELLEVASKAKETNRVNGLVLGQHMMRNQQALNVLQGNNQPAGTIYGPNGQTTASSPTRRFVVG